MKPIRSVLLTGHRGYLGSCLSDLLLARGYQVQTLPGRLEDILPESLAPDAVIHAAACRQTSQPPIELYARTNVEGTRRLLAGLTKPTPLIFLSSRQVYGQLGSESLCSEADRPEPMTPYGISKLQAEQLILESPHPSLMLRTTAFFGAGLTQLGRSFIEISAKALLAGQPITLYTPDSDRDYLYVWDLATGILKLLATPASWPAIINAAGPRRSIHALLRTLIETSPNPAAEFIFAPGKAQAADYPALTTSRWQQVCPEPTSDRLVCQLLWKHLLKASLR